MGNAYLRRSVVIVLHVLLWSFALVCAIGIRFDGAFPSAVVRNALELFPILLVLRVASFWRYGLFHGILRYAGVRDLSSIVAASAFSSVGALAASVVLTHHFLPRSIYLLEWVLAVSMAGGLRFAARLIAERANVRRTERPAVVLLGAGDAGELVLRDAQRARSAPLQIVAVLDDDPAKTGSRIHGVPVVGSIERDVLVRVLREYGADRVVMAMPSAPGVRTRAIVDMCRELSVSLKTIPSPHSIADGSVRVTQLRDVAIEDLLGRPEVWLDTTTTERALKGKRVLVTGAAGSIGSELVRQLVRMQPSSIVLFDHNENGLFFLERELRERFPRQQVVVRVGSIRDDARVRSVFRDLRPQVVFHAAAHKHVPLMEENPGEAVKNNVLGTYAIARASIDHRCDAFVLISTDKAVNPRSVMGTTKRVAELIVQALGTESPTRCLAVRFGNVLGSNGSVVPIFRAQIEAGGPVTVTHPEMRRYFMTIPEAARLVVQASGLGKSGEIMILDMGEPVKIVDLARDLISLSGLRPDVDVEIRFSGLRPGEKLSEELLGGEETAATAHPQIFVASSSPRPALEMHEVVARLERVVQTVDDGNTIRAELSAIVTEAQLFTREPAASIDSGAVAHDGAIAHVGT